MEVGTGGRTRGVYVSGGRQARPSGGFPIPPGIGGIVLLAAVLLASSHPVAAQCDPPVDEVKLTASDGERSDRFGYAVSISGDWAVVGAPGDDDAGESTGAAYVYLRAGGSWSQEAKLLAGDAAADSAFGYSVSIKEDRLVVGAPNEDVGGLSSGAAYVYVRSAGTWVEEAKLEASDEDSNMYFGYSVSQSGDTVVIGASGMGFVGPGAAYVYVQIAGTWTEQAKLLASDGQDRDSFGESVSVDGDVVVVGASDADNGALSAGAAYVFTRSGSVWSEAARLGASDPQESTAFGQSVSMAGDVVVVGDPLHAEPFGFEGAVYVFVRNGAMWPQQAKVTASSTLSSFFGESVSLRGDILLVGAAGDRSAGSWAGAAYLFLREGDSWTEVQKFVASDAVPDLLFGTSVSLDLDRAALGAPHFVGQQGPGAAYVYSVCIEQDCANGADDDGDTLPDCEDPDCYGPSCPEVCGDDADNDGDTLIDCEDPDCYGPSCPEVCDDGDDNDGDTLTDCEDPDCFSPSCPEICDDGLDNDDDGWVDCDDRDCFGPDCAEECADRQDNDGDTLRDCADPDCDGLIGPEGEPCEPGGETLCADGADNDGDTLRDCADPDCDGLIGPEGEPCEPGAERSCGDGADNDADGRVDCLDRDCFGLGGCPCPQDMDLPGGVSPWCSGWDISGCVWDPAEWNHYWDWHPEEDWDSNGDPTDDTEAVGCRQTPPWTAELGRHGYCYVFVRKDGTGELRGCQTFEVIERPEVPAPLGEAGCEGDSIDLDCGGEDRCAAYLWDLDVTVDSDGDTEPNNDRDGAGCSISATFPAGSFLTQATARYSLPDGTCSSHAELSVVVDPPPQRPDPSGSPACPGQASSLDCGVSEPDVIYTWDFDVRTDSDGNGIRDDDVDAAGCTSAPTYGRGWHTSRVTAANQAGCTAWADLPLEVTGPDPPEPVVTVACPGEPAGLDCGVDEPGVTYTWDLDTSVDTDADTIPDNDVDATGCAVMEIYGEGNFTARAMADDGRCILYEDAAVAVAGDLVPGEPEQVRLSREGHALILDWRFAPGGSRYRVVRGNLSSLHATGQYDHAADPAAGRGECDTGPATSWTDPDDGQDGNSYYFLVTGINDCSGFEGSTGFALRPGPTERDPRTPSPSCP